MDSSAPDIASGSSSRSLDLADIATSTSTGLDRLTAKFSNSGIEKAYRNQLAAEGQKRERTAQILAVLLFLGYGALDLIAAKEFAAEFIAIRFLYVAPPVAALIILTSQPRLVRFQEWTSTLGLLICSAAIIYMIKEMPMLGSPPYIVGLLFSMILASCLLRVSFVIATISYLVIAAAYCGSMVMREDTIEAQVASGVFFMVSVTGVACITNYVQEWRSREIWLRNIQRRYDKQRIESLLIEATAADRSKLSFLTILTHELRTPLHQIIGYSEVLRNEAVLIGREDLASGSTTVLEAARDLLKKISQLLRFADATAGKLSFATESVPVGELIESVADQTLSLLEPKSIRLNACDIEKTPLFIDQHHTLYALMCVVENAANASAPGSEIKIDGKREDNGLYRIRVIDRGHGMSTQELNAALAPFEQLEVARTRARRGLGLGLPIADRLIRCQGGALRLESTPGVGTTVSVWLPLVQENAQAAPQLSLSQGGPAGPECAA